VQTLSSRPLSDSDRDEELFVGRASELRLAVRAVRSGINVLVLGLRGSGRTTFLYACARQLRRDQAEVIWLNAGLAESPLEVVDLLAFAMGTPRKEYVPSALAQALEFGSITGKRKIVGAPDGVLQAIGHLRQKLEEKGDATPRIVLLDDPSPEIVHTLFGRARDELWTLPVTWIVSGDELRSGDLLKPPADAFFARVVHLPTLTEAEADTLLALRIGDLDAAARTRVIKSGQGNPRLLLLRAADALLDEEMGEESETDHTGVTEAALELLSPAARRLWDALLPMGQASATDEILLRQLGWSRQRAGQLFQQLVDAGVVEVGREHVSQGRPRKVYRIVMPR
jgi:predicted transcriptional regulator